MIRVGLLGASRIATGAIIEPAATLSDVCVQAVAARDVGRARTFARTHRIPDVARDYATLVSSNEIDLVYIGLPPSEHMRWTLAALRAGKHVLCEKPFAMSADEAATMIGVARQERRCLIEAFHYRFHPLFERVMALVDSGAIGRVQRVDCHFNVPVAESPVELRYDKALGGGAMMDLGCYTVHWARCIAGEHPAVASAAAEWHPSGVDVAMKVRLAFPGGAIASLSCSMADDLPDELDTRLSVTGERGGITVQNPLVPQLGHRLRLKTESGEFVETFSKKTTYYYQLQHVTDVLERGASQLTGGLDAVDNMRVLDDVYRQAAN